MIQHGHEIKINISYIVEIQKKHTRKLLKIIFSFIINISRLSFKNVFHLRSSRKVRNLLI